MNGPTQSLRARRREWLRQHIACVCGHGGDLEQADLDELPYAHRDEVTRFAAESKRLYEEGRHAEAFEYAREECVALEQRIGSRWLPPSEPKVDRDVIASIPRGGRAIV
jgi:hypothetical protein